MNPHHKLLETCKTTDIATSVKIRCWRAHRDTRVHTQCRVPNFVVETTVTKNERFWRVRKRYVEFGKLTLLLCENPLKTPHLVTQSLRVCCMISLFWRTVANTQISSSSRQLQTLHSIREVSHQVYTWTRQISEMQVPGLTCLRRNLDERTTPG